jgi:RNA polymerase sigma-70 factor (ECF subfamily)
VSPPDTASAERALVEDARGGCQRACEAIVRTHAPLMRAVALRILGDESDADDAVQEAFLSAFKALERFAGKSSLGTWLHRITVNAALMKRRAKQSVATTSVEDLLPRFNDNGTWAAGAEPAAAPAEDSLDREELYDRVRQCVTRIPEKYATPFLMRHIEGIDNEEIARRLDITVNAAKLRVHRARQAVRTLLEPMLGGDPR